MQQGVKDKRQKNKRGVNRLSNIKSSKNTIIFNILI
jgi:hypothetical protein